MKDTGPAVPATDSGEVDAGSGEADGGSDKVDGGSGVVDTI